MRRALLLSISICFLADLKSQLAVPYLETFEDSIAQNWTYPIGSSWNIGLNYTVPYLPIANNFYALKTCPPSGFTPIGTQEVLSPYFDLTDTSVDYVLSFYQNYGSATVTRHYVYYRINAGGSWILMNNTPLNKYNWYTSYFFGSNYSSSGNKYSAVLLNALSGMDSVQFKFTTEVSTANQFGWLIDNFRIGKNNFNIADNNGDTIKIFQNVNQIIFNYNTNQYNPLVKNKSYQVRYYLSADTVLDGSDMFLDQNAKPLLNSVASLSDTVAVSFMLPYGTYYLMRQHDVLDSIAEEFESDNLGYSPIVIDTVFALPYHEDFESNSGVSGYRRFNLINSEFKWGLNKGTHTAKQRPGKHAWYQDKKFPPPTTNFMQYNLTCIKSPAINIKDTGDVVFSVWIKAGSPGSMEYSRFGIDTVNQITDNFSSINEAVSLNYNYSDNGRDQWVCYNYHIPLSVRHKNARINIKQWAINEFNINEYYIDDIYVGQYLTDLTSENGHQERFLIKNTQDTIHLDFRNVGKSTLATIQNRFYLSVDSIFDIGDLLIHSSSYTGMPSDAVFTEHIPILISSALPGSKFYLFYQLDDANVIAEMREDDNFFMLEIYTGDVYASGEYFNDFELTDSTWRHHAIEGYDPWEQELGNIALWNDNPPTTKCFITEANDLVDSNSVSYLVSPIFNLTSVARPVITFESTTDFILGSSNSQISHLEYSFDGGYSWNLVDTVDSSYNLMYYYYNDPQLCYDWPLGMLGGSSGLIDFRYPGEGSFVWNGYYQGDFTRVQDRYFNVYIPNQGASPKVIFRFAYGIDDNELKGMFIDNFKIASGKPDLKMIGPEKIYCSDSAMIMLEVENIGNLISNSTLVNIYLSNDSIWDGADILATTTSLHKLRPNDFTRKFVNVQTGSYSYVIARVVPVLHEDSLSNNFVACKIETPFYNYPYYNDYSNVFADNWTAVVYNGSIPEEGLLWKTNLLNAAYPYPNLQGEEFWLDQCNLGFLNYQLISPAFDFSSKDSIIIEYDLYLNSMFPTIEYSIDNKNSWQTLYYNGIPSQNWLVLYNEPVCNLQTFGLSSSDYVHSIADISTLVDNEPLVYFRFKICGPIGSSVMYYPAGFRVDNFQINADSTWSNSSVIQYDNPFSVIVSADNNHFAFSSTYLINKINVYDLTGKILISEIINNKFGIIDLSGYSAGAYLLNFEIDGHFICRKVIVN